MVIVFLGMFCDYLLINLYIVYVLCEVFTKDLCSVNMMVISAYFVHVCCLDDDSIIVSVCLSILCKLHEKLYYVSYL